MAPVTALFSLSEIPFFEQIRKVIVLGKVFLIFRRFVRAIEDHASGAATT